MDLTSNIQGIILKITALGNTCIYLSIVKKKKKTWFSGQAGLILALAS